MQGVRRVRRCVGDALAGVDDDHPVSHPRRLLGRGGTADERKQPICDHDRQPLEQIEVDPFQRAPPPRRTWRPDPAEHSENLAAVTDGDVSNDACRIGIRFEKRMHGKTRIPNWREAWLAISAILPVIDHQFIN